MNFRKLRMIYFISEKCVEERFARRFRLPPRGSTVTNTASISASCLGSSIRITHRRLVSLSIYSLSKFSGSACFPCAVSFWPRPGTCWHSQRIAGDRDRTRRRREIFPACKRPGRRVSWCGCRYQHRKHPHNDLSQNRTRRSDPSAPIPIQNMSLVCPHTC